ncbi:MAG: MBL fold metallo-hydrolase [Deltaproteobacteria bacterium]|jgi:glyoxylase-like metal-dependent hydrolase (beta-lactamase superfamily II)|nr:MBL fold metallo-hydrolase [Deltaproteobacteria bacterium]
MAEEMMPGVYRIVAPLPGSPLKNINSYLIKGSIGGRHLLVDNAFNHPESLAALLAGLDEAGARPEDLDLFITHCHADHLGLTKALSRGPATKVYGSAIDAFFINEVASACNPAETAKGLDGIWGGIYLPMQRHGFSRSELELVRQRHPAALFGPGRQIDFTTLEDGDILEYGAYRLRVLHMPGHSPGLLTLYAEEQRLYFSADHILGDITPNISFWSSMPDPLGTYLASLDRAARLDIRLSLPAHRREITDTAARIEYLKQHHAERLEEVLAVLTDGPLNARQTASRMTWSGRAKTWDEFPPSQKWFAVGEAFTHLCYLAMQGRARETDEGGNVVFSRL